MCGVLGGVFRRPVGRADVDAFRRAIPSLRHRGPDAEAVISIPAARAVLAFRRLAIIDLDTGDQPMATDGAEQHIVLNGEIYNYRDIRRRLEREGVTFRTRSDTEVLLHILARRGFAGLDELHGMYGFGFLDIPKDTLLLGRDRLGVKQLYVSETEEGVFFASEPKALLALPWVPADIADEQLAAYFTFRCVPAGRTLFRHITKLAPGTVLSYKLSTLERQHHRYWALPATGDPSPPPVEGHPTDRVEAALLAAVERRLVADVPVGAFLSGGLDSSLVVAAMYRLGHADLHTFSATFPGSRDDESAFARRVAARFNTSHHEHAVSAAGFVSALTDWVELNDDLVADASSLPLLYVSRLARSVGCIVLLSGEGADEQFGGYGSYHKFIYLRALSRVLPAVRIRRAIVESLSRLGVVAGQDKPRVNEYFVHRRGYMGTAAILGSQELTRLIRPETLDLATSSPRATGASLANLSDFDFVHRIPDDLLVRTDRATMGASIEARVPFLDHEFVTVSFGLPTSTRALPGISKVVLRKLALRWNVPYQTVLHRKIGFQLPIGQWFRSSLTHMWDTILGERLLQGLSYPYIAQLLEAHRSGKAQYEEILWRVAALELWYRRWVLGSTVADLIKPAAAIPTPRSARKPNT